MQNKNRKPGSHSAAPGWCRSGLDKSSIAAYLILLVGLAIGNITLAQTNFTLGPTGAPPAQEYPVTIGPGGATPGTVLTLNGDALFNYPAIFNTTTTFNTGVKMLALTGTPSDYVITIDPVTFDLSYQQINLIPNGNANGNMMYWDNGSSDWIYTSGIKNDGDQTDGVLVVTNTGSTAANPIFRLTNGSNNHLFMGQTGNLGIGTTSTPTDRLHIHQSTSATANYFRVSSNSASTGGRLGYAASGTDLQLIQDQNSDMVFFTGGISNERMRITHSTGNVGIGTTGGTPDERLHVKGSGDTYLKIQNSSGSGRIGLENGSGELQIIQGTSGAISFYNNSAVQLLQLANNEVVTVGSSSGNLTVVHSGSGQAFSVNPGGGTDLFYVDGNGFVGVGTNTQIGTEILNVNGHVFPATGGGFDLGYSSATDTWRDVYGINNYTTTSDQRAKTNIQNLKYGIKEIMKLTPRSYEWKVNGNGTRLGFISQEVLEVVPEVVVIPKNDQEAYMMRYSELIPILVKAMQEQQQQIESMNGENGARDIEALKQDNDKLRQQVSQLTLKIESLCDLPCIKDLQHKQNGNLNDQPILFQNNPNPFNTETEIFYYLPKTISVANIRITSTEGKIMQSFQLKGSGNGVLTLSSGTLSEGTYYYTLICDGQEIDTKKIVVLKQ